MKIERDIKEPEWNEWQTGRQMAITDLAEISIELGDPNNINFDESKPFVWQIFSTSTRKFGRCPTVDEAKAAAWAAYLNLIFH